MARTRTKLIPATGPDLLRAVSLLLVANAKRGQSTSMTSMSLRARAQHVVNEDAVLPFTETDDG